MTPGIAIYTDLDGTLLDHDTYSHAAADGLLAELEQRGIPVIPCTSKTRAELLPLRRSLHNRHPFIVENGAAVVIPKGYFTEPRDDREDDGDWRVKRFSAPRSHWLDVLDSVAAPFAGEFTPFSAMSIDDVCELTGLDHDAATLAMQREYGEPVHWHGDAARRETFIQAVQAAGANVLQGGRFLHLGGDCDKGRALRWLNDRYAAGTAAPISIAAGDSHNDIAMLEAADHALIVRSPAHPPPPLQRSDNVSITDAYGPAGWAAGLRQLIDRLIT